MTAGQLRAELGLDAPRSLSQCALILPGDRKSWRRWIRANVRVRRVALPNGVTSCFYTLRDVYSAIDAFAAGDGTGPSPPSPLPRTRLVGRTP